MVELALTKSDLLTATFSGVGGSITMEHEPTLSLPLQVHFIGPAGPIGGATVPENILSYIENLDQGITDV